MLTETLLGVVLALGAAASIAAVGSFGSRPFMELESNPSNAAYIGLILSTIVVGIAILVTGQAKLLFKISPLILALFGTVGIIQNAVGRRLWFVAIRNIGANQSNTLISTEVIYSVIFAVIILGEKVGVLLGLGTTLVVLGALLIEGRRSAGKRSGNLVRGYESSIVAAILFGLTPIFIRYGLASFPHFLPALFVTFSSATIFYTLTVKQRSVLLQVYRNIDVVIVPFMIIGILTIATQLFIFTSLLYAPVVYYAPILSTYPQFTVIFTRIQVKHIEVFGPRTLLSAILVVAGAVLVSIASL